MSRRRVDGVEVDAMISARTRRKILISTQAMSPDRLEDSDDDEEDDGWGPGSDDEESTKKKKKPVRYGPPDEESAAKALRKALSHLEDSDGNNIALWYPSRRQLLTSFCLPAMTCC